MTTGVTKPEWDTPPHGDFASYVERLTATPPARAARAAATMAAPRATAGTATSGRPAAAGSAQAPAPGQTLPADLAQALVPLLVPLMGMIRIARVVLLLFIVMHAIALFIFSQGSLAGLIIMGAIWWGLGWLAVSAPKIAVAAGNPAGFGTDALQERLRQLAQQRHKTGKKKPQ